MRILSLDLGERNTAWALIEKGKPKKCGMIKNLINDLTDRSFNRRRKKLKNELLALIADTKPSVIVAERFQVRGFNAGSQTEHVSVMLGMLSALSLVPTYLITASTWKNYMLRHYGENTMEYIFHDKFLKDEWNEHECDAIGIGLWYWEREQEKKSKWYSKLFPIPDSCDVCWYSTHGCKGVDERICKEFLRVDKAVRCTTCSSKSTCEREIKQTTKAKTHQINRNSFGCTAYDKR